MKERSISFDAALNEAARKGLCGEIHNYPKKFVQQTFPMGAEQAFNWDKALALADALEDEEIMRNMALGK